MSDASDSLKQLIPSPSDPAMATYAGAATSGVFWGLHVSDFAVIVGALVAVIGLLVQMYDVFVIRRRQK